MGASAPGRSAGPRNSNRHAQTTGDGGGGGRNWRVRSAESTSAPTLACDALAAIQPHLASPAAPSEIASAGCFSARREACQTGWRAAKVDTTWALTGGLAVAMQSHAKNPGARGERTPPGTCTTAAEARQAAASGGELDGTRRMMCGFSAVSRTAPATHGTRGASLASGMFTSIGRDGHGCREFSGADNARAAAVTDSRRVGASQSATTRGPMSVLTTAGAQEKGRASGIAAGLRPALTQAGRNRAKLATGRSTGDGSATSIHSG